MSFQEIDRLEIQPTGIPLASECPEEKFVAKLMCSVASKMEDPEFEVEALVKEIGMSRPVFYKKVQTLTNYSVADLIKERRLKRAPEPLRQNTMSLADVAFVFGFNDRKYFSEEFKKHYKISPLSILKNFSRRFELKAQIIARE